MSYPFMPRARELGACWDCTETLDAAVVREKHPECYDRIIAAMDERYGHIPHDGSLRLAMYADGVR